MTDPLMPIFCCKKPQSWTMFYNMVQHIDSIVYNSICLISSTCGMLGAAYLILPQLLERPVQHWYWISSQRAQKVILWLAVSDFLASAGIFSRSLMNLWFPAYFKHNMLTSFNCYLLSFGIQYFYIVSWFWTLIYSFDTWLALREKPSYLKLYHSLAWTLPAIFTFVGLCILYLPTETYFINTHSSLWRFLPNYLVSYIPLVAVMTINATLYFSSFASIPALVSQYLSQYTNAERYVVDTIKMKFVLINLTFFACWLPNIANAIVIFSNWEEFPERVVIALWYIMAIINPLQAFFNSIGFGKPAIGKFCFWKTSDKYFHNKYREKTPLLHWQNAADFDSSD